MKIKVYAIAKTDEPYLRTGVDIYCNKLIHYFPFEYIELPALKQIKNLNFEQQRYVQNGHGFGNFKQARL